MKSMFLLLMLNAPALLAQGYFNMLWDFEAGSPEFSSQYTVSGSGPGTYEITSDPILAYPEAYSFGDHTTGVGNMLVADGATTDSLAVWEVTLTVPVGSYYTLQLWAAPWADDGTGQDPSPAILRVEANGAYVVDGFWAPQCGVWSQHYFTIGTVRVPTLTIRIADETGAVNGNGFSLDDIWVYGVPEPTTLSLLGIGSLAVFLFRLRR